VFYPRKPGGFSAMINVRALVIERWLAVIGSIPDNGLSRCPTDQGNLHWASVMAGHLNQE
jgi:hypothetical protein